MADKFNLTIYLDDGTEADLADGITYIQSDNSSAESNAPFDHILLAEQFALIVAWRGFAQKRSDGIVVYPAHRITRIDITPARRRDELICVPSS